MDWKNYMGVGHLYRHGPFTLARSITWAWTHYMGMDLLLLLVFIQHFDFHITFIPIFYSGVDNLFAL